MQEENTSIYMYLGVFELSSNKSAFLHLLDAWEYLMGAVVIHLYIFD